MNNRWMIEAWAPESEPNVKGKGAWQRVGVRASDADARELVRSLGRAANGARGRRIDGGKDGLTGMRATSTGYAEWTGSGGAF